MDTENLFFFQGDFPEGAPLLREDNEIIFGLADDGSWRKDETNFGKREIFFYLFRIGFLKGWPLGWAQL